MRLSVTVVETLLSRWQTQNQLFKHGWLLAFLRVKLFSVCRHTDISPGQLQATSVIGLRLKRLSEPLLVPLLVA
jgi:hypothetical protein